MCRRFVGLWLLAGIGLVNVFLTALKAYRGLASSFGGGMLLATAGAAIPLGRGRHAAWF
jgi:hypothetical protein